MNRPAGYAGSNTAGAWVPALGFLQDANQYVGVNLGGVDMVLGIVLQGREDVDQWVKKFKVAYKGADTEWVVVKDANQEKDMESVFEISFPFYNRSRGAIFLLVTQREIIGQ